MAVITLNAELRTELGGSSAKQLRRSGRVPGVVYGHGENSRAFHVKELDLRPLVYTHETHTVSLVLDGSSTSCILREIQFHPVTDRISHIDLVALHAGEKVRVEVPVNLTGSAQGVKDGGVLDVVLHKIAIECLPDAIPARIDLDISSLKIGHSFHVSNLPDHPGYAVLGDAGAVVVTCVAPKTGDAETADATAAAPAEPEQIKAKGKKEEEG